MVLQNRPSTGPPDSNLAKMHVIYNKTISDRLRISFWILEVFELIFCSIILGITGSASVGMKSDLGFEKIPGKLSYNIGAVSKNLRLGNRHINITCFIRLPSR